MNKAITKAIASALFITITGCAAQLPAASITAPTTSIGGSQIATVLDTHHEVLMLGDSVTLGYAPSVTTLLNPLNYTIDTVGNTENSYALNQNLQSFLAQYPNADTITFNAGIWDTIVNSVYFLAAPGASAIPQIYNSTDAEYQANIISIGKQLVATNKKIIFFLSTDCLPNDQEDVTRIAGLNAIALQVLPPLGIQVVDIHTLSLKLTNHHVGYNHFDDAANALLAGVVSNVLLTQ